MQKMTSFGLDERLERVLAYSLLWVSGLFLFVFERNRNVRWHAMQSMLTFGTLTLLLFAVTMLQSMLGWIPVLGLLTTFGLNLLFNILRWTIGLLWLWLMVMAWLKPDYRLPFVGDWVQRFL